MVRIDAGLVQQARVQSIDNAAKYSQDGSQITVRAETGQNTLLLTVRDEGVGLTEHDKAILFDRFVRGERYAATTSGSGLGLWIASAFITANGGHVNAVSEGPGLGTTLTIELPAMQTAVPQMEGDADD